MESLNKEDIRDHLLAYHNKHFSANLMSLCVVGNHDLDVMEEMVRKHFGTVENKHLELRDFSSDPLFDDTVIGHLVQFVPVKDTKMLTINWPRLPSVKSYWDGNPLNYLANALGDEGKHSLLSELIRQDLAVKLMAGPALRLQGTFAGFYIEITLTKKGMDNYEDVIRMTFSQINKFREKGA